MKRESFFIVSTARSGSTSLAKILDLADDAVCQSEPVPNFNQETRWAMDGKLSDQDAEHLINTVLVPRVQEFSPHAAIYGEKQVTLAPFIPQIHQRLNSKFIFLHRDGREVVSSLLNWHNHLFGSIYRECSDINTYAPEVLLKAANLPVHLDTSDYSRPRPLPGTYLYPQWEFLSREEMCAYYWSFVNEIYMQNLAKIPAQNWKSLSYTNVSNQEILETANFVGIKKLSPDLVKEFLDKRINSVQERIGQTATYPSWHQWNGGLRNKFDALAGDTMKRLGYYQDWPTRWKPKEYGLFWQEHDGGEKWYNWMYEGRAFAHQELTAWIKSKDASNDAIYSMLDVGCGLGVGYTKIFSDREYHGADISRQNHEWCLRNYNNPLHQFHLVDFIEKPFKKKFDLVFSSGTIDNTYDIDEFISAMVQSSKKWIQFTSYRGWFPELEEHIYWWNPEHGCFYNNLSVSKIRETLMKLGCTDIEILPLSTGKTEIPYETLVRARVGL